MFYSANPPLPPSHSSSQKQKKNPLLFYLPLHFRSTFFEFNYLPAFQYILSSEISPWFVQFYQEDSQFYFSGIWRIFFNSPTAITSPFFFFCQLPARVLQNALLFILLVCLEMPLNPSFLCMWQSFWSTKRTLFLEGESFYFLSVRNT